MARGPKKHMKRVAAPSHWMLDKLKGVYAPRPSPGPHKLRECVPLVILLRNRLKYALTYNEVKLIVMQKLIKIDGRVRCDVTYPAGFMDVVSIEKTNEFFRLVYDTKGRFRPHKIRAEEAAYKLCKVKRVSVGSKGVPTAVTHDGRTIRYIHPEIKANDSIVLDIAKGTPEKWIKFEVGKKVMITGGHNVGRVGNIIHRERHPGSFEIVHVKDAANRTFATRINNVFVIGESTKSFISLPKGEGFRKTTMEDREEKLQKFHHQS